MAAFYLLDHSDAFVAYRFTAPVLMHTVASFIGGITLHALFNIIATILSVIGTLDIE